MNSLVCRGEDALIIQMRYGFFQIYAGWLTVDSTMYSAPAVDQGMAAGSLSANTVTGWPLMTSFPSLTSIVPLKRPWTESYLNMYTYTMSFKNLPLCWVFCKTYHVFEINEWALEWSYDTPYAVYHRQTYSLIATTSTPWASIALRKTIRPIRPAPHLSTDQQVNQENTHRNYEYRGYVHWGGFHKLKNWNSPVDANFDSL